MELRRTHGATLAAAVAAVLTVTALSGCQTFTRERQTTPTQPRTTLWGQAPTGAQKQVTPSPTEEKAVTDAAGTGASPSGKTSVQQMIVRDKTLTMEVKSVRTTIAKISTLSTRYSASITSSNISSQDGDIQPLPQEQRAGVDDKSGPLTGTITIKVPAAKFDVFLAAARKLGRVQSEAESTEDVTQQHIDMKARLKNLRAEEAAFVRFFRAAKNVSEMLAIERQLSRVRGEIESLQAQVEYLERRAAMATLTLNLSEPGGLVSPPGEDWGFVDAIRNAIRAFVTVVNFLVVMVGALLPIVIVSLIGFWFLRWLLRRFVFKKTPS